MKSKLLALCVISTAVIAFFFHQRNEEAKLASFISAISNADAETVISDASTYYSDLSSNQAHAAIQLLFSYLHTTPPTDELERAAVFATIEVLNTSSESASIDNKLISAISKNDAESMIRYLLSPDFSAVNLGAERPLLAVAIENYSEGLPRAELEKLIMAQEALILLEPEDSIHVEKLSAYIEAKRTRDERILNSFNQRVDDFNGNIFYTPKSRPRGVTDRSYFLPYIVKVGDVIITRIRLHYTNDEWLFIEGAQINIDGESMNLPVNSGEWERDHGDGMIWEWADVEATSQIREVMRRISESDKSVIRLMGSQYYYDYTVSRAEKAVIRDAFLLESILSEP